MRVKWSCISEVICIKTIWNLDGCDAGQQENLDKKKKKKTGEIIHYYGF